MKIDATSGLIKPAKFCQSPNYDERPDGQEISLLVIHNISLPPGDFENNNVKDFFTNQLNPNKHRYFKEIAHLKVSAHLFISRMGQVWQFVPFTKRAWHAGKSSYKGLENCNHYSIGIELEGTDELPYTPSQYQQLAAVSIAILEEYPKITLDRIVGHCDIAPLRKTDPGPSFDWPYYQRLLKNMLVEKQS